MGCARSSCSRGAATRASARCTGCATRWSTAGRGRSSSRSTRHAGMARPTPPAPRTCRSAVLRGYAGTDLPAHTLGRARSRARSPASSWPRCRRCGPTSAIIHAQRADRAGQRAAVGHHRACRRRRCWPSARSIVTVEEVVDELEPGPGGDRHPGLGGDAVAVAPRGAHPSYAHGYYDRDNGFYVAWDAISRDRDDVHRSGWTQHVLGGGCGVSAALRTARTR